MSWICMRTSLFALLCLIAALAGCSGGSGGEPPAAGMQATTQPSPPAPSPPAPPPATPPSQEREISPNAANSAVTNNLAAHVVINPPPSAVPARRLFLMLPGTGATPRTYREIVRLAAQRGWHAIGLSYPNDEAVEGLCGASADPDCAGRLRREVILGEDTSPLTTIGPANAIQGRLLSLITYLHATAPNEGWGDYLFAGQVDWSRVVAAGHSQGAGHAGYLGKLAALDRIVMFSGPGDTGLAPNSSAQWLSLPNVTAPSRQFGFTHTADPLAPLASVTRNWTAIGIDGATVSVDGAGPPFSSARRLITSAAPNPNPTGPSAAPAHGAPVVDAVTPREANGAPVFIPVWTHLAFS